MLRITLTRSDLDQVRVAARPAPLLELRTLLRRPRYQQPDARVERRHLELVRDLVAQPCAPAFLLPTNSDVEEAVELVSGARRDTIRRDLADNVVSGHPLPAWTADLARPGHLGTRARSELREALMHTAAAYVQPRLHQMAGEVDARTHRWREATRAGRPVLDALHRCIRLRGSTLEVDLGSGADVEATASGAGIVIVPTLARRPGVTLSSDRQTPTVLTCPVPVEASRANAMPDRAVEDLIGTSRALVLAVVAAEPGLGTRELARRTGLAPASVSTHLQVLRSSGLVEAAAAGRRLRHRVTALGRSLLEQRAR